ncbi:MAG: sulfotransferase [Xanthomonadaceae bacterium]|nr:sulfotransferase [Xanthomonadaceae bacterium]
MQTGDYEAGLRSFARAAELAPHQPAYHLNRASALIGLGRFDEAEGALEACLALAPRHWQAHYSLAQLRRWTPERHHVARLEALLPRAGDDPAARTCLHLALAKEYEDLGRYPEAMEHLVAGKRAARPMRPYTPARDAALVDALIERFGPVTAPPSGDRPPGPVFVVGMPRSGTTLVDRILSCHPQLRSAGELNTFGLALAQALGSPTPQLAAETVRSGPTPDWPALGATYLHHARAAVGTEGRFSDKLPHNFLYLGAIARALPDARFVVLRRQPMDTCLSNFRQLFAAGAPMMDYSYTLEDIGQYYVQFDRLMTHWERCLPGRLLTVSYEALVDDQEAVTRRLLAFCGLPWDDACLAFERNAAPVTTPSAVQVRSALHRDSLERWKRYGTALDGLRAILANAGLVA